MAKIKFGPCPVDPVINPKTSLLTVDLNPDPVIPGKTVDVTFSGSLNVDIPANSRNDLVAQVAFLDSSDSPIVDPFTTEFCTFGGITCPMKSGTAFKAVHMQVPVPGNLAKGDSIAVAILQDNFIACAGSSPIP